jgi:OOP family OmpA-OmpF porin
MTPEQLEQILPLLIIFVIIEGIGLSVLTFLVLRSKGETPIVEEVFTVYKDGRLIKHICTKSENHPDNDIFTGMMTAAQEFIKDSFASRDSSDLQKIELGNKRIYFERGEHIYLALVYTGDADDKMKEKITDTIDAIETTYSKELDKWKGLIEKFDGIETHIKPLLDPDEE